MKNVPVVCLQRVCTFGRYISRSFVDNPFQESNCLSRHLSHLLSFLGKAFWQLTWFAPACSTLQASPTHQKGSAAYPWLALSWERRGKVIQCSYTAGDQAQSYTYG